MTVQRAIGKSGSAGFTLVEVMIALFVLAIGILGFARVFPSATRTQTKSKIASGAGQYANEKFETLRGLTRTNTLLSAGRHPSTGYETLGAQSTWQRYYNVSAVAAPLDSLLRVDVVVRWTSAKPDSVRMSGYLFP